MIALGRALKEHAIQESEEARNDAEPDEATTVYDGHSLRVNDLRIV
jgi:hypothetical protein